MKKLVMNLLLLVILSSGTVSAITVDSPGNLSSCNSSETKDTYLYLQWDGVTLYPDDTFWSEHDAMISNNSSV